MFYIFEKILMKFNVWFYKLYQLHIPQSNLLLLWFCIHLKLCLVPLYANKYVKLKTGTFESYPK